MKSVFVVGIIVLAFFGGSVSSKYLGHIPMLARFFEPAEVTVQSQGAVTVQSQGAVIEQIQALNRLEYVLLRTSKKYATL